MRTQMDPGRRRKVLSGFRVTFVSPDFAQGWANAQPSALIRANTRVEPQPDNEPHKSSLFQEMLLVLTHFRGAAR